MIAVQTKNGRKPQRFRAEIWDQMQFFFREYNDHQLRGAIFFQGCLDRAALKKAIFLSMAIVPLLGSRFVSRRFRPYWEKAGPFRAAEIITFVETTNLETAMGSFLTGKTEELTGPQIKARLIRCSGRDTLCIVMNHMVGDGAGFKEYLYLLAELYTRQAAGNKSTGNKTPANGTLGKATPGNLDHLAYPNGSRDSAQIYRQLDFCSRLRLFFLPNEPLHNDNDIYFPLSQETGRPLPYLLRHPLPAGWLPGLMAYGREQGVTVNDIVLAAFYRALYQVVRVPAGDSLTIPVMVDLRRYLPGKKAGGLCNLSSMLMCNIGEEIGATLAETIRKVNRAMQAKKNGFPGLHGLATLNLLFTLFPFPVVRRIIKRGYKNPLIGITNIGVIDSGRLRFGDIPVADAFVTGSLKYSPYFQLALSSFGRTLTFCIGQYGFPGDIAVMEKFFGLLEAELRTVVTAAN
jgi:NRPS condensation-like uncharacterized protein